MVTGSQRLCQRLAFIVLQISVFADSKPIQPKNLSSNHGGHGEHSEKMGFNIFHHIT
jgi:hypothetical protein